MLLFKKVAVGEKSTVPEIRTVNIIVDNFGTTCTLSATTSACENGTAMDFNQSLKQFASVSPSRPRSPTTLG